MKLPFFALPSSFFYDRHVDPPSSLTPLLVVEGICMNHMKHAGYYNLIYRIGERERESSLWDVRDFVLCDFVQKNLGDFFSRNEVYILLFSLSSFYLPSCLVIFHHLRNRYILKRSCESRKLIQSFIELAIELLLIDCVQKNAGDFFPRNEDRFLEVGCLFSIILWKLYVEKRCKARIIRMKSNSLIYAMLKYRAFKIQRFKDRVVNLRTQTVARLIGYRSRYTASRTFDPNCICIWNDFNLFKSWILVFRCRERHRNSPCINY